MKNNTIMKKIMTPMMLVMLLQMVLFYGTIVWEGTLKQLNMNAFDILNERVINRKNYIENEMIQRWSKIDDSAQAVNLIVSNFLQENKISSHDLTVDNLRTTEILNEISDTLIYLLRKQSVTGSFVILNGDNNIYQTKDVFKSGVYIRDSNPVTNAEDNSDLMIVRAPSVVTKRLGIPMDTTWYPQFHFIDEFSDRVYDFFYKPMRAAIEHPEIGYMDLGYWSPPFKLSNEDIEIITYTIPLIGEDNAPYGVLGVELSVDYLKKLLPYDELAEKKVGSYVLAMEQDELLEMEPLIANGPIMNQVWELDNKIRFKEEMTEVSSYKIENKEDLYGCVQYLRLYNSNTPFEQDKWALIGILQGETLFGFSQKIKMGILLAIVISLGIGLTAVVISSKIITRPVIALVRHVKNSNPNVPVKFDKTNIMEIDELAKAVELLNVNVVESATKLTRIIEMASIRIGAFECQESMGRVFLTKSFFQLFGQEEPDTIDGYMDLDEFNKRMDSLKCYLDSDYKKSEIQIYKINIPSGTPIWISVKIVKDEKSIFGVAEDVSQNILEKKKIEHERDYDLLTNLLNRRAFYNNLIRLFDEPEQLKTAAMIMLDLDNLKHINDTYGHECGDQYLCCVAKTLNDSLPFNGVLSRMSGDEFYIFIYGYEDQKEAHFVVEAIKQNMDSTLFTLPDNTEYRVRASMGIAWFPNDSTSYSSLVHYADFAMYTVKNTVKGEMRYFDSEEYEKNAYLLQSKEELNKLIDKKLVEYHFQPIVDAITGDVFAYEALMRSKLDTFKSPIEILALARSQFKLYQIERLTWFEALKEFVSHKEISSDCHVFINSIANQILSLEDIMELEEQYQPYLKQIVIELTEEEKQDNNFAAIKQEYAHKWNASIALDDFGSGYNGEVMLLYLKPNYVKIDMSIVTDIDKDKNRLQILQNLVSYSKERKIKIIAEGVQTKSEMETLVKNGVDYLQGYYLGKPEKNPGPVKRSVLEELLEIRRTM